KLPSGKIIDVGAGRGIVTGYLHKNGINIQGVELGNTSPVSHSNAPVFYNTDVMSIDAEQATQFKTASFFDVIDNIEKPVDFMRQIVSHFKNVEYIIITIPARSELWSNFDDYYGHFRRYNLEMVHDEIKQLGFQMISCRYFFHLLYLMIRINNALSKKRNLRFVAPTGISKWIHSAMAFLFYIEKYLIPGKWLGSSIVCIAKKTR